MNMSDMPLIGTLFKNHEPGNTDTNSRDGQPQGPYTNVFNNWVAREVNPYLYEAIREGVGPIDAAINMTKMLDGIVGVDGENQALVDEISDWMEGVRVGDLHTGFQTFYELMSNEMYEQGHGFGDYVIDRAARDVTHLRVGDSKGTYLYRNDHGELEVWYRPPTQRRTRGDGTDQLERVLRNSYGAVNVTSALQEYSYRQLDPAMLVWAAFNPEADNPYGTSIMRSTEFDAKVLLTMKNSLLNVWERFGDPSFVVKHKVKKIITKDGEDKATALGRMRDSIATALSEAISYKRAGNSGDLVHSMGTDDELDISILGADGQVLEIEAPARHILENIVSKTSLPSWMLGFHWSTAERLAQTQGELALQASKTRFATRRPGLMKPVAAMLRARGRTWKRDDFMLVQELPSIRDMVAEAQANFLNAQAEMVSSGGNLMAGNEPKLARVNSEGKVVLPTDPAYNQAEPVFGIPEDQVMSAMGKQFTQHKELHVCGVKQEDYVEDADNLMRLERRSERDMLNGWDELMTATFDALELPTSTKNEHTFLFNALDMMPRLRELEDEFVEKVGGPDSELARSMYDAWLRGVENAAEELSEDAIEEAVRAQVSSQLADKGLRLVTDAGLRAFRNDIVAELEQGAYNGMNPVDVARSLRKRFAAHEVDWVRIARSEIAAAQADGKLAQYTEQNIEQYEWVRAGGACPICIGREEASPYLVGAGPRPVIDSHPNCRCTVVAYIEEDES